MLGAKIYIDFTKYDFEECSSRLRKELSNIKNDKNVEKTDKKINKILKENDSEDLKKEAEIVILEDNIIETKKELSQINKINETDASKLIHEKKSFESVSNSVNYFEKNISAFYWTEEQSMNWLIKQKIKPSIIESIAPCDGKLLQQLYQMSEEVPEFFYSSLRADTKASLKDVAFFTSELKSLFIKS